MKHIAEAALTHWGMAGADCRFVAARENTVYQVVSDGTPCALRLHRRGYRSDAELASELIWMAAMAKSGVSVPAPIPATDGRTLQLIAGVQVDMLSWLSGAPLEDALPRLSAKQRTETFFNLGRTMALMHTASDDWTPPSDFTRCAWDARGLLGDAPLWDRFWKNPELTTNERAELDAFRNRARTALDDLASTLDYGLIHADLVPANVMVSGTAPSFIDFDDSGYGYRLFDVATALFKWQDAVDFADLKTALLDGYRSIRSLDTSALPLFTALRAVTYVGWNITRMAENSGTARNARFIENALKHTRAYNAG